MKSVQSFASALHLFVLFIIFGGSAFLVSLYFAPEYRGILSYFLVESPLIFALFGLLFFVVGILLTLCFYALYKPRYLSISMQGHLCDVDVKIISKYLEEHIYKIFPEHPLNLQVTLTKNNVLEILAHTSAFSSHCSKKVLKETEKEIAKVLKDRFAYRKRFILTLSSS